MEEKVKEKNSFRLESLSYKCGGDFVALNFSDGKTLELYL